MCMTKALIIKNSSFETPGLLTGVLTSHGVPYDIVDLYKNDPLPKSGNFNALIVLGAPDSANDATYKIRSELAFIKQALAAGTPILGICLGMQLLVKAAGGKVMKAPQPELGFTDLDGQQYFVEIMSAGKDDPLLAGLPAKLPAFHVHYETVSLTQNMALLATGHNCRNQIVKVSDKAYGIQAHFELLPHVLEMRAAKDPDLAQIGQEKLMADFAAVRDDYLFAGKKLLNNFVQLLI